MTPGAIMAGMVLALVLVLGGTASGEQLVSTVSNPSIEITSSFDGEVLTLFGNVEPDPGARQEPLVGPYDVIVVVTGPSTDRVARLKTDKFGIWLNTEQVRFKTFPSFYHVLASDPLDKIASNATLEALDIPLDAQTQRTVAPDATHPEEFGAQLIRLMQQKGLFGVDGEAVRFLSPTAYSARLLLPGDITNGLFITHSYLFKNGALLAKRGDSFSVTKTGFERFVSNASRTQPWLYGLACVVLALFTGWLAGVAFRR